MGEVVRGYKAFCSDWTCRGFQYEVGKEYTMPEKPECCERGFHFCLKANDCFDYYHFGTDTKFAEVEAFGEIAYHEDDSKACTNGIRIVREIPWSEVLELVNAGKACAGRRNSGNWNSGDRNSGNWNSGDWNYADFSAGCFNTEPQKIRMFNKETDWTLDDWFDSAARRILVCAPYGASNTWVPSSYMTDEEKKAHPEYETLGGYLRTEDNSENITDWWNGLQCAERAEVKKLPNFDWDVFCKCTGIDSERGIRD